MIQKRDAGRTYIRLKEHKRRRSERGGELRLKPSKGGRISCMIAGVVLLVYFLLLLTAYINRGETPAVTGALGLIIMIAGWFGVAIGVRGLREIEKDYRSCRVGIVLNGILAFSLTALFLGGLF